MAASLEDLLNFIDKERNVANFTSAQKLEAAKLKQAIKVNQLPEGFSAKGVHVRREKLSGRIYLTNNDQQMCMFNEGRLEIYYRCPKCLNEGLKNTLSHSSRCDQILW